MARPPQLADGGGAACQPTAFSAVYVGEVNPGMKVVPISAEPSGDEPTAAAFIGQRIKAPFT
jgi:hypothetical protein